MLGDATARMRIIEIKAVYGIARAKLLADVWREKNILLRCNVHCFNTATGREDVSSLVKADINRYKNEIMTLLLYGNLS